MILREKLAELCHEQWSGWMKYLFSKNPVESDGSWVMPAWAVERWQRQMDTPYSELSESEKQSDRNEADKFLVLLERENAELRKLLTWLLSGPKCTCKDHDCRWQQEKCACGYDEKMQEALNACKD